VEPPLLTKPAFPWPGGRKPNLPFLPTAHAARHGFVCTPQIAGRAVTLTLALTVGTPGRFDGLGQGRLPKKLD